MSAVPDGASRRRRSCLSQLSGAGFVWVTLAFSVAGCHGPRPAVVPAAPLSSIHRLQLDIDALLRDPALTQGTLGRARPVALPERYPVHHQLPQAHAAGVKSEDFHARGRGANARLELHLRDHCRRSCRHRFRRDQWRPHRVGHRRPVDLRRQWIGAPALRILGPPNSRRSASAPFAGRVIGDDNAFDDVTLGAGWMWDDLDEGYSAGIGALQIDQNVTRVTVSPGPVVGGGAVSLFASEASGLTLHNGVTTGPPGSG